MGRKSRRNRSNHKGSVITRQNARQVMTALLLEEKIERMEQAAIMRQLITRHQGDVPVPALWRHRAMRYQQGGMSA